MPQLLTVMAQLAQQHSPATACGELASEHLAALTPAHQAMLAAASGLLPQADSLSSSQGLDNGDTSLSQWNAMPYTTQDMSTGEVQGETSSSARAWHHTLSHGMCVPAGLLLCMAWTWPQRRATMPGSHPLQPVSGLMLCRCSASRPSSIAARCRWACCSSGSGLHAAWGAVQKTQGGLHAWMSRLAICVSSDYMQPAEHLPGEPAMRLHEVHACMCLAICRCRLEAVAEM